jgi:hypothetical protein
MDNKRVNEIISNTMDYIKNPEFRGVDSNNFGKIALNLYDLHRELNPVYKKYDIGPLTDYRQIPLMPIGEFKKGDVGIVISERMPFPGVEFHSSGTTQNDKSKHRMYDTEAYRASIANCFDFYVTTITPPTHRVILLTPKLSNSSLYYMMSYISELKDYRGIREEFSGMTDPERTRDFIEDLSNETEPVILFGTSLAFYDLKETIESLGLESISLPRNSLFIETGGWKGRDIKLTPKQLTSWIMDYFDIPQINSLREYSMSEISSQLYSWENSDTVKYSGPEWLLVRCVDPLTQTEVPKGESGIISFVDLANVWSCPFILTEDVGHFENDMLVLEGRAVSAPEKGCSLTYAEAMGN